ncbi:MAG: GNAT family N-acetyltransferase [Taibaiella sp.]|nr:GNAT family N-acetyltransferase [Taibaiella sp.]
MKNQYLIHSLEKISFDELFATHIEAFKDYPFQWGYDAFRHLLRRRSYVQELSFGAFYDNKLVSFTLNGIGNYHGIDTAYDTGTGTIEQHRGKGLASAIFQYAVPFLKEAGIKQYLLEVLEDNTTAYSVYSKQGFSSSRTFDCFRCSSPEWTIPQRIAPNGIVLKDIDLSYRSQMEGMNDFPLSWQNSFESLSNMPESFQYVGAFYENDLVGYGIVEPTTGDVPLLAVAPTKRRKGIGSLLLKKLQERNMSDIVKVVNIDSTQTAAREFVTASGIPHIVSQYEMIKPF